MLNLLKNAVAAALIVLLVYAAVKAKRIRLDRIFPKHPRPARVVFIVILAAMFLPAGYRLALLPLLRIPEPMVHDEFVHLLTANTLLSGRLANPPHPLWQHLDTTYILWHPSYASVYPLGQGAILAAGQILTGYPWAGVVLATALMCGGIAWVLFEVLPLRWAAAGALPVAFTYGLQWVGSYWGGAFCGFGGALLFGALLRLRKSPSLSMAIVAGLGWSIIWLIRPFESIVLFVLLWASVTVMAVRPGAGRDPSKASRRWLAPIVMLVAIQSCAGMLTLMHNRAATGSFFTMPQKLDQKISGVPQSFVWQPAIPPPQFRFPEMKEMYLWQLHQKQLSTSSRALSTVRTLWGFFVTPWFSLPLLLTLLVIHDRIVAAAWGILVCALAATLLYPFFFPHYVAAYSCVFAFLILRGLMVLDGWSVRGARVGRWLALFILFGGLLYEPVEITPLKAFARGAAPRLVNSREYISDELKHLGGAHVVFVRYGPNHFFHYEWVYNAANVDASPVVWCRWMGIAKDREVMRYYPDRQYWIVDVDGSSAATNVAANLSRYH